MDNSLEGEQSSPDKKAGVIIMQVFPGMDPSILEIAAARSSSLLVIGHANGAVGETTDPTIKKIVDAGTPVFILSDNPDAGHGVVRFSDQPQVTLRAAGAVMLETVNVNNAHEVGAFVQESINQGLRGPELAEAVRAKYTYPEGAKPISPLGTIDGLATFQAKVEKALDSDATD